MLSKPNRLPSSEIPRIMKYGKRVHEKDMIVVYKKRKMNPGSKSGMTTRMAFIVSTKIDKRATVRNRVKRLLSESLKHMLGSVNPVVDGVIIAKKGLVGLSQKEVEEIVIRVFTQAGIYHNV